jgi:uncharacterized protein YdaU (DUF1376 family)
MATRMNALWWWIDRWRKSTAYTDMTLEQQGAYRNLLDEAWLRGGALPGALSRDHRVLAKACGDPRRWPHLKNVLLKRFVVGPDGCWHNETLDKILKESTRRADKQRAYRTRKNGGNESGNKAGNRGGSPDPDLSSTPYSPPKGGRPLTRDEKQHAERVLKNRFGRCHHHPRCPDHAACVERLAVELREKRKASR